MSRDQPGGKLRSDAPDHLVTSLLHALTVAVAGSSHRKRLAEYTFARLASSDPAAGSTPFAPPVGVTPAPTSAPATAAAAAPPRSSGLIRFLYEGCLFPPARAHSDAPLSVMSPGGAGGGPGPGTPVAAAAAVAESSLGPRCKKRESRRAAFALLAALCREEATHLRQVLLLLGGRDLVVERFLDSTDDEHWENRATAAATNVGSNVDVVDGGLAGRHGGNGPEKSEDCGKVETGESAVAGAGDTAVPALLVNEDGADGVSAGEPWDYDPTSVLKESGQHVGLQNQVCACDLMCMRPNVHVWSSGGRCCSYCCLVILAVGQPFDEKREENDGSCICHRRIIPAARLPSPTS